MGLGSDRKLSWRMGQGGEVFQQERKPRVSSSADPRLLGALRKTVSPAGVGGMGC